jgi:hypothetical protein
MKSLFFVATIAMFTGCIDSGTDIEAPPLPTEQLHGAYVVGDSTIERHTVTPDTIELYTPGAAEVGIYAPATDHFSTMPATPDQISRFLQALDEATPGALSSLDATRNLACRSGNGKIACRCPKGCCNDHIACWCC